MGKISDWRAAHGRITWGSPHDVVMYVQQALVATGASLVIDGEFGSATEAAVKRFQAGRNLVPVGWVGIRTAEMLDVLLDEQPGPIPSPAPSVLDKAPWLTQMRAITGTRELPGEADSPIILAWRDDISQAWPEMHSYSMLYKHDATSWCGHGMAGCFARAFLHPAFGVIAEQKNGLRPPFGSSDTDRYMWALSWQKFGSKLRTPIPGCVMVFSRSGGGHVSLLEKMDGNVAIIRGCNQSDMVNVERHGMDGFVAAVWPEGWPQVAIVPDTSNTTGQGSEV